MRFIATTAHPSFSEDEKTLHLIDAVMNDVLKKMRKASTIQEVRELVVFPMRSFMRPPKGVSNKQIKLAPHLKGIESTSVDSVRDPHVILFFHGGAYIAGCAQTSLCLSAELCRRTRMTVVSVDYRLAPEYPFPAAVLDATDAYMWVLRDRPPSRVLLAGESAGGGLCSALLLHLKSNGKPMPLAVFMMSPWLDLRVPPLHCKQTIPKLKSEAELYLNGADALDPLASPIFGNLERLPPMLIQTATSEHMIKENLEFVHKAAMVGTRCVFESYPGYFHSFQYWYRELHAADRALANAASFIRNCVEDHYLVIASSSLVKCYSSLPESDTQESDTSEYENKERLQLRP
eukprot:Gregarina_sp_Poly_1__7106@NODE_388_length_8987_cov_115_762892_g317_i0_p4_GENE_NODE_388_length_8987_cov_115_762892_g317_i0NODE_388_length_8987_cov_115_762892_g317_i0_p4_ORF_typecomplete_len347_score41_56Abhydrolase_3/PF07859_13/1_1e50Say1_Mug180/PF10340_9/2e26COesterase/PF00135_28/1_6e11Hydrolase_4/PF12146_8/1_5e06Peptidase_S9/PF00326_21/0_00023Abhydrolase_6/PF12697_7/0_0022Thioesterase/PF00975_20/9_6e03Thioesterase/PF00975_20/0_022Lipase_3/PF01764_25/0_049Abhydrolase_2/PF02230_16/8_7e03Abhydrola